MRTDHSKVVRDEEGIVIFDRSDDFDPGEVQILNEDDELDTDYLLRETARQEAQQEKERKTRGWVSAGVIAAVVAFIAGVCYINFRNVL